VDAFEPMTEPRASITANGQALRDSEERFRLLVDSVRDYAIFMLDPQGCVVSWNAGAERIKGYTGDEIIGRHFSVFYPQEDRGKPAIELEQAARYGRLEDEGWRLRKGGERFWANVVITALYDERHQLRGYAKVTRDLTERRAKEEAERRAAIHQEASRLKDDFLAIVSHELRTPLNVAIGQASMLRGGGLAPDQSERAWASLQRNLRVQAKIIDDLLDVSRVITGNLTLERRVMDLRGVLKDVVEEIGPAVTNKGVDLRMTVPQDALMVMGDSARLRQVFSNLLSNAVKFTPAGGSIDVECTCRDGMVSVGVTDSGIGIASEFLPSVFDRFTQADSTARREFGGLGLGLAITRELVARHDGVVLASSRGTGKGTMFEVRLPMYPPPDVS
jgi:PAS domain S-box-containing protein